MPGTMRSKVKNKKQLKSALKKIKPKAKTKMTVKKIKAKKVKRP